MPSKASKLVRVTKLLLAGVTVFCVSWIASVNEWHAGVRWSHGRRGGLNEGLSTMRTIVAYSPGKQAELDRPSPVTCDRLPAFPKIPLINRTWSPGVTEESSWQRVAGTRVSLYAAYYDDRVTQRYIRILASFHGRNFSTEKTLFCQTRSSNPYEDSVEVVAAKPTEIWYHEWDAISQDVDTPLLLSCPLTEPLNGPSVVSVVTQPCDDPTNAFTLEPSRIKNNLKRTFTICVKDMNFNKDISQNLLEWIETNKILKVDMIDMYVDRVSKQSENILLYYQDNGYVRLFQVPIKHKLDRSLWQRRRDHIITYNDCLYRNIQQSVFVIPLDVDEIILPKIAETFPEMLARLNNLGWNKSQDSAILIQNVFFFDFMQGLENKVHTKNKTYEKRDDVRINELEVLEISEIELIGSMNNLSSEVIDFKDTDEIINDEYKSGCGDYLSTPKLVRHIVRSALISPVGYYSKSLMLTERVLTAFNHYPLSGLGGSGVGGWSAPFSEVQVNHYKESCNTTVVEECARYWRRARVDRSALRLRRRLMQAIANAVCTRINT